MPIRSANSGIGTWIEGLQGVPAGRRGATARNIQVVRRPAVVESSKEA